MTSQVAFEVILVTFGILRSSNETMVAVKFVGLKLLQYMTERIHRPLSNNGKTPHVNWTILFQEVKVGLQLKVTFR